MLSSPASLPDDLQVRRMLPALQTLISNRPASLSRTHGSILKMQPSDPRVPAEDFSFYELAGIWALVS
jgi:hypothetical protein